MVCMPSEFHLWTLTCTAVRLFLEDKVLSLVQFAFSGPSSIDGNPTSWCSFTLGCSRGACLCLQNNIMASCDVDNLVPKLNRKIKLSSLVRCTIIFLNMSDSVMQSMYFPSFRHFSMYLQLLCYIFYFTINHTCCYVKIFKIAGVNKRD